MKRDGVYSSVVRKRSVGRWFNRTIGYDVFPTVTGIAIGWQGVKGHSVVERGDVADLAGFSDYGAWETNLNGVDVTDDDLAGLSELPNLEWIIVAGWPGQPDVSDAWIRITDAGILSLTTLPKLKVVYLCHTGITRDGANNLADSLPSTKIVYRQQITAAKFGIPAESP